MEAKRSEEMPLDVAAATAKRKIRKRVDRLRTQVKQLDDTLNQREEAQKRGEPAKG
jgi:hypothetical protein